MENFLPPVAIEVFSVSLAVVNLTFGGLLIVQTSDCYHLHSPAPF
jgi:hypothetical protein